MDDVAYPDMAPVNVDIKAKTIETVMTAETITVDGSSKHLPKARSAPPVALKVVLFAANPRTMTQLAIDEEAREIDHNIRMAEHRDALQVVTAWAVRPDDVLQQLHRHRPAIVQFSGHGVTDGSLMLVDANGVPKAVTPEALEALFSVMKDDVRIVFLNACYSQIQAEAIHRNIDYVIGMRAAVGDITARVFAAAFYRALGFGCTVQRSFEEARTAVMLDGLPDDGAPVLLVRPGASTMSVISSGGAR